MAGSVTNVLRIAPVLVAAVLTGSVAAGAIVVAAGQIDGAATASSAAARVDTPRPPAPSTTVPPAERTIADDVIDLVNAERAQRGLAPFAWQSRVTAAAEIHSRDMAATQNMSHTGSDGSNTGDRLDRVGFDWRSWGETVAAGFRTPESVVDAWMNSDGHRQILLGDNTLIGVSMVPASNEVRYWTIVVAT